MNERVQKALMPRDGAASYLAATVRVVTGVLFVLFGIGKFVDHAQEAIDFDRYGIPFPDVAVYLSGAIEVLGGLLLIAGLLTRVAALLLAVNLIVAIATAGRVDGGSFHLGVGPTMLLAMLFLLWAGGGVFSCDGRWAESHRVRMAR